MFLFNHFNKYTKTLLTSPYCSVLANFHIPILELSFVSTLLPSGKPNTSIIIYYLLRYQCPRLAVCKKKTELTFKFLLKLFKKTFFSFIHLTLTFKVKYIVQELDISTLRFFIATSTTLNLQTVKGHPTVVCTSGLYRSHSFSTSWCVTDPYEST